MNDRNALIIWGFIIVLANLSGFFVAMHGIDLSYNVIKITESYELPTLYDRTISDTSITYEDAYINCTRFIFINIALIIAGCVMFGYGLGYDKV